MRSSDPRDRHYLKKLAKVRWIGYQRFWDSAAKAPYLFNSKTRIRIAYEDTASVDAKWQYVRQQQLAGLMYWDYFSDPGRRLLRRLADP